MIPQYLNCANEEILVCDFYMNQECPNTCAYARDIGIGFGAVLDSGLIKKLHRGFYIASAPVQEASP